MSFFKEFAIPAAVVLSVVSMGSMNAAQAQSGKRIVVAMAPADLSPAQEAKPMRAAPVAPRARHVAIAAPAARADKPDCFWCNRSVYISGLTF
jgi:hypothetical protein